jgi:alpha-ketoglutarate-dependent taurine dioxygenase
MYADSYYTLDCSKVDDCNNELFGRLREALVANGYVKVKCDNVPNEDYHNICLNLITRMGGNGCPYGSDPHSLVWPVKVLALDSEPATAHLPGTNVDRELHFHTDCSYEHKAPDYVALYFVQRDRTEKGGKFQLVHTKEIIDKLSPETKRLLRDETYKIIVRPAYRKDDNDSICVPIVLNDECMRYQPDLVDQCQLQQERPEKKAAITELNSIIFAEDQLNIFRPTLENNMLILFNNHLFLHGRTRIEDIDRHLLRIRFNLNNT